MAQERVFQIVFGSDREYHPKKRGTLRSVVSQAADASLQKCTSATIYSLSKKGFGGIGRALVEIGKPIGCRTGVRGPRFREYNVVTQAPEKSQRLVRDEKRSQAGKTIVLRWMED